MKFVLGLSLLMASGSSFALPLPSHEAIKGLQTTGAFERAEKAARAGLPYYDQLNLAVVGRNDSKAMNLCHPSGAISKSATLVKVTFTNSDKKLQMVNYFTTPNRVDEFSLCRE